MLDENGDILTDGRRLQRQPFILRDGGFFLRKQSPFDGIPPDYPIIARIEVRNNDLTPNRLIGEGILQPEDG